jgi:hypothetical protein
MWLRGRDRPLRAPTLPSPDPQAHPAQVSGVTRIGQPPLQRTAHAHHMDLCDLAHFGSCALRIVAAGSVFHAFNLVGFATRQRGTVSIRHQLTEDTTWHR